MELEQKAFYHCSLPLKSHLSKYHDAYHPAKVRIPAQIELILIILKGHDATYDGNTLLLLRNLKYYHVFVEILLCRYSDKPRLHQNCGTHNLLQAVFTGLKQNALIGSRSNSSIGA
jgi:hypothetical protein